MEDSDELAYKPVLRTWKIDYQKATALYRRTGIIAWDESFSSTQPYGLFTEGNGIIEVDFWATEEERDEVYRSYEGFHVLKGDYP